LPRIRLAVDNERTAQSAPPTRDEPSSPPLPWAVCLLIWAAIAIAGWATIALLVHLI
jgi:hypothetical protein